MCPFYYSAPLLYAFVLHADEPHLFMQNVSFYFEEEKKKNEKEKYEHVV